MSHLIEDRNIFKKNNEIINYKIDCVIDSMISKQTHYLFTYIQIY